MPKYKLPPNVPGINIGGQQYNADSKGEITLPDDGNFVVPAEFERVVSAVSPEEESALHQD